MDRVLIKDLEIFANHGVFDEENKNGQKFYVSCELYTDLRKAGKTDDLANTVNYGEICYLIKTIMQENTYNLIETCAEKIAEKILLSYDAINKVIVLIKKPSAPIGLLLEYPAVIIERARHEVFIAMGSNIGQSRELIEEAVRKLNLAEDIRVEKVSELIVTKPYGVTDQPDFINGVMKITTLKTPHELLDTLHKIEAEAGRERVLRWGPRTLDLDIIFYDDIILEDGDLCIPHVDMQNRDFVLKPLNMIAPYKIHPVLKKRVKEMLDELERKNNK